MLKGTNIYLRALEPKDIDLLYKWENNPEIWPLSNTLIPYSKYTLEEYIHHSKIDIFTAKQLRLVICLSVDERPIGCIDLFDFDPYHKRAGVGILIAEQSDRKNGYGSEALEIIIDYSFNTLLLHQLFCNVLKENEASLELFQKFLFQVTGNKKQWVRKKDVYVDEYFLQLINPVTA